MSLHYVPPAVERRWVEEVLYLHALWRRGPPRRPIPSPNPSLRPANPPAFKKHTKNKKQDKKTIKNKNKKTQPSDPPVAAEVEWPCPPTPPPNPDSSGWNNPAPAHTPSPPSAEDQARAAASRAQQRGLRACEEFFSKKSGSDDDEDEEEDDAMDEDGGAEFSFFLGLFEKDDDLRVYYEKNCDKGEFFCLVCQGIGVKKGRRYPNCVGLVQHANSIFKTKRRVAHRALAKAVCRVLAWDIKRLPNIVLDLGEPLGKSLVKAADQQEALGEEDATDKKEELQKEVAEPVMANKGDQMDCGEIKEITDLPNNNTREDGNADQLEEL